MAKKRTKKSDRTGFWPTISLFFFDKYRLTLVIWILLLILGTLSYTTLLKREGFPPIAFPLSITQGTYFVDDVEKVDQDVTKPLSQVVAQDSRVSSVQTIAFDNFFTVITTFEEEVDTLETAQVTEEIIGGSNVLPATATADYVGVDPTGYLNEFDILISVYDTSNLSTQKLEMTAQSVADQLLLVDEINRAEVQSQFSTAINPFTGEPETRQSSFGRLGLATESGVEFYNSSTIGLVGDSSLDITEFSEIVHESIDQISSMEEFAGVVGIDVSADFAPSIETQISSLLSNMLTALLAVSVITLLLITWRASIITALFMVTVMLVTLFILYLIGYSVNTITLFALVLALGLFVDDATIIVEAIDAQRKNFKKSRDVVKKAISKVAAASFAGTMTTVLVFLPLVFVTGLIGDFIRILPVTIIIALLTSLILSLTIIPFLSRFILLSVPPKPKTPIGRAEDWLAEKIASAPMLIRKNRRKGILVSLIFLAIPIIFIMSTGYFAQKLEFNIFPPAKDADQLQVQIGTPPGSTIQDAEDIADDVNDIIAETIEEYMLRVVYFDTSERGATNITELVPFTDRSTTSVTMVEALTEQFEKYDKARVRVIQVDSGPPSEEFPFKVQVFDENREVAIAAAMEVEESLKGATIERPNGTTFNVTATDIAFDLEIARVDGATYVEVRAGFDADDLSATVLAAEEYVKEQFPPQRVAEMGLAEDALGYDQGFESENQDSFSSLGIVFPIALLLMFTLLAIQFRSLLQPILIFLAIPFSVFGVFAGLYATDNPLSFFVMVGFFGLIGIAVNNTILLTDYANQEQRDGEPIVEAISKATQKRFRPLITTSLTTVVALLPLALTDPFWEALAFTIIFGLLSSTLLVIVSFPFYYLYAEALRRKVRNLFSRKAV